MPTIRIATPEDIPACVTLLGVLFAQEEEFTADPGLQTRGLEMIIASPAVGTVFICEHEGAVVGMASLLATVSTALGGKVALLEDMVVLPACRGRGFGTMLVDHACRWARENGFGRITLLTDGDNEQAHRFYETLGFVRSGMAAFRKLL